MQFAEELIKQDQVAVVPGDVFGSAGDGYIRSCVAASMETINQAIERIERFVGRL